MTITQEETRDWWETTEIKLPKAAEGICNGIWDDDSIFELKERGDFEHYYALRFPTPVLLRIIQATRELVETNDSWFSRQEELKQKFVVALGLPEPEDPLEALIVETPKKKVTKRGRPKGSKSKK